MAYVDEVLADSPFAYWRLNETSGSIAADETTNNADGTYVDTPTLNQVSEANLGTSVLFEGSLTAGDNESVSIATTAGTTDFATFGAGLDNGGAYTLEFWMNTTSASTFMAVVGTANTTPDGDDTLFVFWVNFSVADTHQMRVRADDGTTVDISFSANLNDGNWHHVVVRDTPSNGTGRGVFVDGSSVSFSGAATLGTSTTSNFQNTFRIAAQDERGTIIDFYNGRLDEVALYQSILSNARIQAHHDAGIAALTELSGFSATASDAKASLTVVPDTFSGFAATASDAKATLGVARAFSGFAASASDAFAGLMILDASIEKDLTVEVGATQPSQDVLTTGIKETVSVGPSDVDRGL